MPTELHITYVSNAVHNMVCRWDLALSVQKPYLCFYPVMIQETSVAYTE